MTDSVSLCHLVKPLQFTCQTAAEENYFSGQLCSIMLVLCFEIILGFHFNIYNILINSFLILLTL